MPNGKKKISKQRYFLKTENKKLTVLSNQAIREHEIELDSCRASYLRMLRMKQSVGL